MLVPIGSTSNRVARPRPFLSWSLNEPEVSHRRNYHLLDQRGGADQQDFVGCRQQQAYSPRGAPPSEGLLAASDQGRVDPALSLSYITVALAPSASQQADLEKLLVDQQTPGSPNYHQKWLSPEEYAQRFGVSDADIAKITQWLQGQGLKVLSVARAKNWIAASGTAAQVETAFQTEIHTYAADGETHYANATEPSVPAAFGTVIKSIRGLDDFRLKPRAKPKYTSSRGVHNIALDDQACDDLRHHAAL